MKALKKRYGPEQYSKNYRTILHRTMAVRSDVKTQFLPLYDHLLHLAADSYRRGYFKRAGIELRKARKVAEY